MPSVHSQFSASYDKTTKVLSAVISLFLAVIAIITSSAIVAGIGAVLILLSYGYSPRAYVVSDRSIIVRRLIGTARISLEGIREARAATEDDLSGCIRLWGNGGLWGYYGLFQTSKLGRAWWYVTNRKNTVVVITDQKTTLFSPDDVHGFLAAIRASVPVPGSLSTEAFFASSQLRPAGNRIGSLFGAAIGVVVIAVVALAFLYSPGPPNYTLTTRSLTIHDRFYPVTLNAAAVDVEHIRIVDIGRDAEWRPTERTNGFANGHYQSGWFRVANGQKVRMYRVAGRRLVLLPPRGRGSVVLLEVKQPEQFVQEVRLNWTNRSE